jgi:hypothetical protein
MAVNDAATIATNVPWLLGVAGSVITALIGTVAYGIRAIIKGDLVPRKVVDDIEERADKWEASFDRSQNTLGDFGGRLDAVTEGLRTIEKALTAVTSRNVGDRS